MKIRAGKATSKSLIIQPMHLMTIFLCMFLYQVANAESRQTHLNIPARNDIIFQGQEFSNIALNRPVRSSHFLPDQPPIHAVDGDLTNMWNSGESPWEWIAIDLESESLIDRVRLLVAQSPAGNTVHQILFADQDRNYTLAHTFSMYTADNQWLEYIPDSMPDDVRYVMIRTIDSPSLVGWKEIEVIGESREEDAGHLKYFGYYLGASEAFGNFMDEFEDHCNLVNVWGNDVEFLEMAKLMNLKAILSIGYIFRKCEGSNCLHDDYLERWNAYADMILPYIDNIFAFYPYDEPYLNGNPIADQEKVIQAIKSRFSDKLIYVTYAFLSVSSGMEIPQGYDIVTITPDYGDFSGSDMQDSLNILKTNLTQGQKIILTGDGFSFDKMPSEAEQYTRVITAREYYNIAKSDPQIIGILTFIWPSFYLGSGVRDMPIVENEFRRIGLEIIQNYSDTDRFPRLTGPLSLLLLN